MTREPVVSSVPVSPVDLDAIEADLAEVPPELFTPRTIGDGPMRRLIGAVPALVAEVKRLRAIVDRQLGDCTGCTDEPEETCPRDGFSYDDWVQIAADCTGRLNEVRALHQPNETPDELIWQADGPCPQCGADGIVADCEGHLTICCRECFAPHPEDPSLASPVPWPCPTIRALDGQR